MILLRKMRNENADYADLADERGFSLATLRLCVNFFPDYYFASKIKWERG
jgi:hypothetical protein